MGRRAKLTFMAQNLMEPDRREDAQYYLSQLFLIKGRMSNLDWQLNEHLPRSPSMDPLSDCFQLAKDFSQHLLAWPATCSKSGRYLRDAAKKVDLLGRQEC